ncbi:MAG: cobalt ECF transporter T component CbiQ [Coriobacteriia bacterium]|nr:cobalt ECF transporter T component CbiQ [Coriobacteriia bacterium]
MMMNNNRGKPRKSLARRTADSIGHHIVEVLENEEIAAEKGFLQGIDPRSKLGAILIFSVTASVVRSPWLLAAMSILALVLASFSAVDPASFARKLWGSAGLFATLLALPAATQFITPGPVLFQLGPVAITQPGALGAVTLILRVVASAGFALLIVWTMRWTDLLSALSQMKVPDIIVATLAMAQKQIVSLMRTVEQIHLARESRTLGKGTTAENRRWVTERIAFVLQKSVKTADDVYDAMLARGYSGSMRVLHRTSATVRDRSYVALSAGIAVLFIGIDRMVMR